MLLLLLLLLLCTVVVIVGAPDGVVVNITHNDNDQSIVFSAKVTDNSSVPATSIIFNLKVSSTACTCTANG